MTDKQLPDRVIDVLSQLRSRIRSYVLVEGLSLFVAACGIIFWLSLSLDWLYYQWRRLELPVAFRQTYVILTVVVLAYLLVHWLIARLLRSMRTRALAMVLERQFPEIDNRLITTVELSSQSDSSHKFSSMTEHMLRRTVDEANKLLEQLDLGAVFNNGPLRRAVVFAVAAVVSIGTLAAINQQAMARWVAGYVYFEDEYWKRETELKLRVLAQPGDQVRDFEEGVYRHPRGEELSLLIEIREGSTPPERVVIDYRTEAGTRGSVPVSVSQEGKFRHTISGVLEDLRIWVSGGDYTSRRPYTVRMVEPPRVNELTLFCQYPEYTGLNEADAGAEGTALPVRGVSMSVPLGTRFLLEAKANKHLRSVKVQGTLFDLSFELDDAEADTSQSQLSIKSSDGQIVKTLVIEQPEQLLESWVTDQSTIRLPCVMPLEPEAEFSAIEKYEGQSLPITSADNLRIYLEDVDRVWSVEPNRLTLNAIIDQAPVIETELRGISRVITRKATIPFAGFISDDYGIVAARFRFSFAADETAELRDFTLPPRGQKEYRLGGTATPPLERFEVLPLDLSVDDELTIAVIASDADSVTGPHESLGETYTFKIVSNEELLSQLYQKEINLRRRFEQIISELIKARDDLQSEADNADEGERSKLGITVERSLNEIRQNATETEAVGVAFRDIREEMVNNAVDTQKTLERIDDRILSPLDNAVQVLFPNADEALVRTRFANDENRDALPSLRDSISALNLTIEQLERILNEMRRLESFHEAVELLKDIIDQQKGLKEETRKQSIEDLFGDDLFNSPRF